MNRRIIAWPVGGAFACAAIAAAATPYYHDNYYEVDVFLNAVAASYVGGLAGLVALAYVGAGS